MADLLYRWIREPLVVGAHKDRVAPVGTGDGSPRGRPGREPWRRSALDAGHGGGGSPAMEEEEEVRL